MTTPAAARLYEAQHQYEMEGRRWVVFNPFDKSLDELPFIIGFNNGGSPGWYQAVAIAQDGTCLGQHICSSEAYMEHDLGIVDGARTDRHEEQYRKHYPEGYRMQFVPFDKVLAHELLTVARELNLKQGELEQKECE